MSRTALPPSQGEGGDAQGINRWVNQAGKVKLFHRYKRGDPCLWKREAFWGALGSACTSPGTQVSCNGCSALGMAQIICKNNPQMPGVPRNDPLLLETET